MVQLYFHLFIIGEMSEAKQTTNYQFFSLLITLSFLKNDRRSLLIRGTGGSV